MSYSHTAGATSQTRTSIATEFASFLAMLGGLIFSKPAFATGHNSQFALHSRAPASCSEKLLSSQLPSRRAKSCRLDRGKRAFWHNVRRQTALAALGGAALVSTWRSQRRSRVVKSLDWTRYHLWVYFVDASEAAYSKARVGRFFFERVCQSRSSGSLLYCAAGGITPALKAEEDFDLASSVPGVDEHDIQNIMVPPYTFTAADMDSYDVVVAMDDATCDAVRTNLADAGKNAAAEHLCVIGDFLDAYDVLLAEEQATVETSETEPAGLEPGLLTAAGLQALRPGQPLSGRPRPKSVGQQPLEDLHPAWQELWDAAGDPDELSDASGPGDQKAILGRLLRSAVGLERTLRGSIPNDMRWWNDEE